MPVLVLLLTCDVPLGMFLSFSEVRVTNERVPSTQNTPGSSRGR